MFKTIKKWWNAPITWGASVKASLIGMGICASYIGVMMLVLHTKEKELDHQIESPHNEETEE